MPKLFKKKSIKSIQKDIQNASNKGGRVKMSGSISNAQMNDISNKLEALKAKYK